MHDGLLRIGRIGSNRKYHTSGSPEFIPLDTNQIKVVHYPDCQQLLVWLSHPGREYSTIRWLNENQKIIEEYLPTDRLNGSIQLCWDTLPYPPGQYRIEIDWKYGCRHVIYVHKFEQHEHPEEKINQNSLVSSHHVEDSTDVHSPPVYRDGYGNEIPNEDLIMRENYWLTLPINSAEDWNSEEILDRVIFHI
jgi:hypothetical protein